MLSPDAEGIGKFQDFMRAHAHSLTAEYLRDFYGLPAHDADWFENQDLAFQSLLRFYVSHKGQDDLAFWDIDRFTCNLDGYRSDTQERLGRLLADIERFGSYHLCNRYQLPARESDAALLRELGYEKMQATQAQPVRGAKAGYNLFNKFYPAAVRLFQDMNG